MQPLLDGDVLLYEIGYAAEAGWKGEGFPQFDYVEELFLARVDMICREVGATCPPIFFLTGKTNFRIKLAQRRKYKDRPSLKPFHYYNLKAYIMSMLDYRLTEGLEADDLMAIEQTQRDSEIANGVVDADGKPRVPTIICSRDKDLRGVNGWFYSWELGKQPSFGPDYCEGYGWLNLSEKRHEKDVRKISGRGPKFFLAQCLIGDSVDTIPGLPRFGPVKAYDLLHETQDWREGLERVMGKYKEVYGESSEQELLEQGQLLWMVKQLKDNEPVMWSLDA